MAGAGAGGPVADPAPSGGARRRHLARAVGACVAGGVDSAGRFRAAAVRRVRLRAPRRGDAGRVADRADRFRPLPRVARAAGRRGDGLGRTRRLGRCRSVRARDRASRGGGGVVGAGARVARLLHGGRHARGRGAGRELRGHALPARRCRRTHLWALARAGDGGQRDDPAGRLGRPLAAVLHSARRLPRWARLEEAA